MLHFSITMCLRVPQSATECEVLKHNSKKHSISISFFSQINGLILLARMILQLVNPKFMSTVSFEI